MVSGDRRVTVQVRTGDEDWTYQESLDSLMRWIAQMIDSAGRPQESWQDGLVVRLGWDSEHVAVDVWGASLNRMRNYYRQLWPANPAA